MQNEKDKPIDNFNNYYEFLNNDYPTWVRYESINFPSVTTAYQAARVQDVGIRKKIADAEDYEQLKSLVINIKNPPNWLHRRYKIMETLVRDKFKRNKEIAAKLLATKQRPLQNKFTSGGDNQYYWGLLPNGTGNNSLGKILMTIRDQFNKGVQHEKWVQQLDLQGDPAMFPTVTITVEKQGKKIDKLFLQNRNYYFFGSAKENQYKLDHQSISKFHACIVFDKKTNVCLVDMNSSNGTFLNSNKIDVLEPVFLKTGDCIVFGSSSRKYYIEVDRTRVETQIAKKQQQVKQQLKNIELLRTDPNSLSKQDIRKKIGYDLNSCVLVEGVPKHCSHREIRELFNKHGHVQQVRMCVDQKTGKHQGTGIIYFKNFKDAQNLILQRVDLRLHDSRLIVKVVDQYEAQNIIKKYHLEGKCEKGYSELSDKKWDLEKDYSRSRDKKDRSSR